MTHAQYGKFTLGLLAAWFVFSLTASAFHIYVAKPSGPPLPILLAVLAPIAAFLVWLASSPAFRRFVFSLDPWAVTIVHTWRLAGFTFLTLYAYGILPDLFALPAGWGDITIGATASLVALRLARPNHGASLMLWQALGISDLVAAVSLGALTSYVSGATALAVLPLNLIPTFAVPLLIILHIIRIAQAWGWNESSCHAVRPSLFPAV